MKVTRTTQLVVILCVLVLILLGTYFLYNYSSPDDTSQEYTMESETLVEAAQLAGDYLVRATNADGSFVYEYDAEDDSESSSYNMLRHAGTVYSMMQLYGVFEDEDVLEAGTRAVMFLVDHVQPFEDVQCIVYNDEVKLGGSALAIIALAEYTTVAEDTQYLTLMQTLAAYLKLSQYPTGEFISKRIYSTGEITDFVSDYYPGEAILALCRLYQLDENETWLDVAEKGAQYLINVKDAGVDTYDLRHDHWLLMGLNELYRYRENSLYLNQSQRIAESIMYLQRDNITRDAEEPEWLGSYYTPPRSTPTAIRSEGLIAAFHLLSDYTDTKITEDILYAISLGIEFQLRTQCTQDNSDHLPNPDRALGGFREDLTSYDIRIDYVQHNISSILGFLVILNEEGD